MIETMFLHHRHARRYRQIVQVLLAHGLGGLIALFDPRDRHDAAKENVERADRVTNRRARHLRRALEELGPTFIKLSQILSTRADLLPPVYIRELEQLQEAVAPDDTIAIREILEQELGAPMGTIFASFDAAPLAAPSIGQVHVATLHDGQEVVVKIQRPGVAALVQQDIVILAESRG